MNTYAQIIAALGAPAPGATMNIPNSMPPFYLRHNLAGGGFVAHLLASLTNTFVSWHATIFQNSWDGAVGLPMLGGVAVDVGPYAFHITTTGNDRSFWKLDASCTTIDAIRESADFNKSHLAAAKVFVSNMKPFLLG